MKLKDLKELLTNGDDEVDVDLGKLLSPEQIFIVPEIATSIPVKEGMPANIKHTCNPGDIVASMIACKRYYEITKRKVVFLQMINRDAAYYPGANHPTVDETGRMVTLNKPMFDMIKPLIESQYYIHSMEVYNGQEVHVDFEKIRGTTFVNMPQGSIQAWLFYAFPDLHADISKPWIFLDEQKRQIEQVTKGKVILNFTERYRNSKIMLDYFFLKEYADDLIFAGTEVEHFKFCSRWELHSVPRLEVKDFLELAYAIRGARFLFSNQSMQWNLSCALGTPRLLEVCDYAHNCMPFYGDNNLGFFHQQAMGHLFRELFNKTK